MMCVTVFKRFAPSASIVIYCWTRQPHASAPTGARKRHAPF
jgi:hypothetical protein